MSIQSPIAVQEIVLFDDVFNTDSDINDWSLFNDFNIPLVNVRRSDIDDSIRHNTNRFEFVFAGAPSYLFMFNQDWRMFEFVWPGNHIYNFISLFSLSLLLPLSTSGGRNEFLNIRFLLIFVVRPRLGTNVRPIGFLLSIGSTNRL